MEIPEVISDKGKMFLQRIIQSIIKEVKNVILFIMYEYCKRGRVHKLDTTLNLLLTLLHYNDEYTEYFPCISAMVTHLIYICERNGNIPTCPTLIFHKELLLGQCD